MLASYEDECYGHSPVHIEARLSSFGFSGRFKHVQNFILLKSVGLNHTSFDLVNKYSRLSSNTYMILWV